VLSSTIKKCSFQSAIHTLGLPQSEFKHNVPPEHSATHPSLCLCVIVFCKAVLGSRAQAECHTNLTLRQGHEILPRSNHSSFFRLQDWRCLWCRATVHTTCRPSYVTHCSLGPTRNNTVPPNKLVKNAGKDKLVDIRAVLFRETLGYFTEID
jgi:hypothetical protein